MDGASAAADGGTITSATRNMHTRTPVTYFILFTCSTFFLVAGIPNRGTLSGLLSAHLTQKKPTLRDRKTGNRNTAGRLAVWDKNYHVTLMVISILICNHFVCTFIPYHDRASIPCLDHDLFPCSGLLSDSDPSAGLSRGHPATENSTTGHSCDNSGNPRGHSKDLPIPQRQEGAAQ
jgi:hypothetical protein